MSSRGFFDCIGFIFHDCHVSTPFLLVCDYFQSVIDTIGPGLDSSVPEFGACRVGIQRGMLPEPVLHSVTQGALVGLELYKKIPSVSSDHVDYILLHGHGVGSEYLALRFDFVQQQRNCLYLIAFFQTCLCRKCYPRVE